MLQLCNEFAIKFKKIHLQQVQQHQQDQGYQAHHEYPGVPQIHELPEDQPLPERYAGDKLSSCLSESHFH